MKNRDKFKKVIEKYCKDFNLNNKENQIKNIHILYGGCRVSINEFIIDFDIIRFLVDKNISFQYYYKWIDFEKFLKKTNTNISIYLFMYLADMYKNCTNEKRLISFIKQYKRYRNKKNKH